MGIPDSTERRPYYSYVKCPTDPSNLSLPLSLDFVEHGIDRTGGTNPRFAKGNPRPT